MSHMPSVLHMMTLRNRILIASFSDLLVSQEDEPGERAMRRLNTEASVAASMDAERKARLAALVPAIQLDDLLAAEAEPQQLDSYRAHLGTVRATMWWLLQDGVGWGGMQEDGMGMWDEFVWACSMLVFVWAITASALQACCLSVVASAPLASSSCLLT